MSTAADAVKETPATLKDAATVSDLKELGWRVEKLTSGWSAYEINGDRKLGPATTIAALQTQITAPVIPAPEPKTP